MVYTCACGVCLQTDTVTAVGSVCGVSLGEQLSGPTELPGTAPLPYRGILNPAGQMDHQNLVFLRDCCHSSESGGKVWGAV